MVLQVLSLLLLACLAQGIPEDHISRRGGSYFVKTLTDPPCPASIYSCLNCNTTRICRPQGPDDWVEVANYKCPDTTPFCDSASGTCTDKPDLICGDDDSFICPTKEGHFPDPATCLQYHICENYVASKFKCADGTGYDALAEDCVAGYDKECKPLVCGEVGKKAPFPDTPKYFGYCHGAGAPTIVDRCVGDYELNVTSQMCEAICHRDCVLRYYEDCTKFYLCSTLYITDTLNITLRSLLSCPNDQGFNPAMHMCTDLSSIPDCIPPTTSTIPSTTVTTKPTVPPPITTTKKH